MLHVAPPRLWVACVLLALLFTFAASRTAAAYSYQALYHFCAVDECADGAQPGAVILGANGELLGTTTAGGFAGPCKDDPATCGTVYVLRPDKAKTKWSEIVLHTFCHEYPCPDGSIPNGIVLGPDGTIFGSTAYGTTGRNVHSCVETVSRQQFTQPCGNVFSLATALNGGARESVIMHFCTGPRCRGGRNPSTPMLDPNGNLFGVAGGIGQGVTVYELTPDGNGMAWTDTVLYSSTDFVPFDRGPLVMDDDGNLFGTLQKSPFPGSVVFELSPGTDGQWDFKVIHDFCEASDCPSVPSSLAIDDHGTLYGVMEDGKGGQYCMQTDGGCGFAFELSPNRAETKWIALAVYSFCSQPMCADGSAPSGALTLGDDGTLFGTTLFGGNGRHCTVSGGCGVVFKLSRDTAKRDWTESVIYDFCAKNGCKDGVRPTARLVIDEAGVIYGTTDHGGANGMGTVFSLTP